MRKEYKKEQKYIDWLKSLGCVFYAPLDNTHGFEDLIGHAIGMKTSQGSVEWNDNYEAYQFHAPNRYCSMIFDGVDAFVDSTVPFAFTMLFTALHTSAGNYDSAFALGGETATGSYYTNNVMNIHYQDKLSLKADNSNVWYRLGTTCDGLSSDTEIYNNGMLIGSGKPFTKNQNELFIRRNVCFTTANSYWCIKDAFLFNRELDLETIRKIQGIE